MTASVSRSPIASVAAKTCDTSVISEIHALPTTGARSASHRVFDAFARAALVWIDRPGIGYLPVTQAPYDAAYFAKYQGYAATPLGHALNAARLAFVARHYDGPLVDVGIGCGQFVESRRRTCGFDINPAGVAWLEDHALFLDPSVQRVNAASFWDSLEHIADPAAILDNVESFVFVSLPIFRDLAHVKGSRHYRPSEHAWYFRAEGFIAFMAALGFECVEENDEETRLGREDIGSFAFRRC